LDHDCALKLVSPSCALTMLWFTPLSGLGVYKMYSFWMELNLKCARECSLCTSARSTHYAYGISLGLVEVKTSEMHVLCRNCLTLRFSCYCIAVLASTVCIEQINFCL